MHGIMFHHFHSDNQEPRPGSLSAFDLNSILDEISDSRRIVSPEEFQGMLVDEVTDSSAVMLSFDDSLRSQFEVALPVLQSRGIRAGFAIYSSIYSGNPDPLEIFAAFRQERFENFSHFWHEFSIMVSNLSSHFLADAEAGVKGGFLREFPFYSDQERAFRYVRDEILTVEEYRNIMWELISRDSFFSPEVVADRLWMSVDQLAQLVAEGHQVGLHSHTHPTRMDLLTRDEQFSEYSENLNWIVENLSLEPQFVAHPCGRYSADTFDVMRDLGIVYGFRSSMTLMTPNSIYEIPRVDASNLLRDLRRSKLT